MSMREAPSSHLVDLEHRLRQPQEINTPEAFNAWRAALGSRLQKYLDAISSDPSTTDEKLLGKAALAAACVGDQASATALMGKLNPQAKHIGPIEVFPGISLGEWCARNHLKIDEILPASEVLIQPTSSFTQSYRYTTEPVRFASLSGATWIPGWDFVLAPDNFILLDTGYLPAEMTNARRPHLIWHKSGPVGCYFPESVVEVDEECLLISGPVDGHFGHWMIDFLPRLRGREIVGNHCKIAIDHGLGPKHLECLKLFGVKEQDILSCSDQYRYRFRKLHLYRPGQSMPPNPVHVSYVRHHLSAHRSKPTPGKRIFLSRHSVGTRQVANSEEFNLFLDEFGFVKADMADLSIAEQREFLSDAEILLGAFGTNLLALYFAPPGCTIMALMDEPKEDPTIPHTCALLGMSHHFVICERSRVTQLRRHYKDRDLMVNCAELRGRISEL